MSGIVALESDSIEVAKEPFQLVLYKAKANVENV